MGIFVYMYVFIPHAFLVTKGAQRRYLTLWNGSGRQI